MGKVFSLESESKWECVWGGTPILGEICLSQHDLCCSKQMRRFSEKLVKRTPGQCLSLDGNDVIWFNDRRWFKVRKYFKVKFISKQIAFKKNNCKKPTKINKQANIYIPPQGSRGQKRCTNGLSWTQLRVTNTNKEIHKHAFEMTKN